MSDAADAFIRLADVLKIRGVVATGGQAKATIQAGGAKVNGEVETRRGRKLRLGDKVEVGDVAITVDSELLSRTSDGE